MTLPSQQPTSKPKVVLGSGSREEEMPSSPVDVEDGAHLLPSPGGLGLCVWPYLIGPLSISEQQCRKGGLAQGLPILPFSIMASSNLPVLGEPREGRKAPLRKRSRSVGAMRPQQGSLWEARPGGCSQVGGAKPEEGGGGNCH